MPATPVPAHAFKPETDRSYLCFCPDQGGWQIGEWWTVDDVAGRWILVLDPTVELVPSHVMAVPPDPLDATGMLHWMMATQLPAQGSA